ncbi:MAG: hypothetical protein JW779_01920 [Candidatus Thorarchaeota archaeon]|nr:hypothetical protein [Candidatus Thorarchaeota archaeon]
MQNRTSFLLCLLGGILLIIAGIAGSIGFYGTIIAYVTLYFPTTVEIMTILLLILQNIADLGGVAAIAGGFLLTTNRVGTGKFIIGIAVGVGLIGLIINLGTLYMAAGVAALFDFLNLAISSASTAGIILTIIARQTAKKPE